MKKNLLAMLLILGSGMGAFPATYFVATNGNDSAAGSSAAPWRTIQKAANTMVGGDTVRVRPGNYSERVSETTSGSVGNFITYVSDTPTNATVRGFTISGSFVRVIGFQFTHATEVGHEAVRVTGRNVHILDNWMHNISSSGAGSAVTYGGAHFLVVRGNIISWTGSAGGTNGIGAKAIGNIFASGGSAPVLIEYNDISHTTDYLTPQGGLHLYRNNVLGPLNVNDFGGDRHVDGYQPNEGTTNCFMEANWHVDNPVSDSHLYLDEVPENHHISMLRNVSIRSGDRLCVQWRVSTNHVAAHNTIGQIGFGPRGGPGNGGVFYVYDNSINNVSRNNIFTNVTSGSTIYVTSTGGSITTDHDLSWPLGNAAIRADPRFVDYGGYDFRVQSNSPAINAAGALTTVSSTAGSGNSFTVVEPIWFHDGLGLTEGQKIYVGTNNNVTITGINFTTRVITVNTFVSWTNGSPVGLAYLGSGPDIGAYEYGAQILTSAEVVTNGTTYTVNTIGDARFVVFYQDGIPHTTDYSKPYTATIASGTVTAKAFPLHPQAQTVIPALPSRRPLPPANLRLN